MRTPPRRFSPIRNERARSPSQALGRSRSPYGEHRSQHAPWNALKKTREASSPNGDTRLPKKEGLAPHSGDKYSRPASPSRRRIVPDAIARASSYGNIVHEEQRDRHLGSTSRRRSPSFPGSAASTYTSAPGSISNSRRSSPITHSEKAIVTPFGFRSRSPASESTPSHRHLGPRDSTPPYLGRASGTNSKIPMHHEKGHWPSMEERTTLVAKQKLNSDNCAVPRNGDQRAAEQSKLAYPPGTAPSQPKSYSIPQHRLPQPGSSHDTNSLPSQRRTPSLSLLSAPTGPRGGGFRENTWAGMPGRRMPTPTAPHGLPLGPRGGPAQAGSGSEFRHNSATSILDSRSQKLPNHLAGLCQVVPGGKLFSSSLDPATEKRLSQLDADRERLFEQFAESQKWKRLVIMDWDKLDRESSVGDLKSELADGHLQCITDGESAHLGVTF